MKHVNFMAKQEAIQKKKLELNYLSLCLLFCIFVFGALSYTYLQKRKLERLQSEIATVSQEIETLKAARAAAGKATATQIPGYIENAISWSALIKELSLKIPSSVSLDSIQATVESKKLSIFGVGENTAAASDFETLLAGLKWCEKTNLKSLQRSAKSKQAVSFELECNLR